MSSPPATEPESSPARESEPASSPTSRRTRAAWVGGLAPILTASALGVWRALALGADGVAAAGLIVSAVTLFSTGVFAYLSAFMDKIAIKRPDWKTAGLVLGVSFVATLTIGLYGQDYYAGRPVDVTDRIAWPADANAPTTTASAALTVPGSLNRLALRVLLVDLHPNSGDCSGSTYDVLRLGDVRPTDAVPSDAVTLVRIPEGIKRVELQLTVHPAPGCALSAHIETATFERG